MTAKSADGVSGHLLYLADGTYCFRVYDKDHNFVDYDIQHCDLCVTINDKDAFFYDDEFSSVLDHSPETLGKTNE
jgi:hypothetical protein